MIYLAEFLGSFFLVATVVGSGIMGERLSPDNAAVALLGNTIPTGAILFVLIKMFGPVSGAHFNPAVSTVFLFRKELDVQKFSKYIFCQFVGGMLAIVVTHFIFCNPSAGYSMSIFQVSEHAPRSAELALLVSEIIATSGLILTIIFVRKNDSGSVAMAVALFITAGYWFTSSTSFANPMVTISRIFTDTFTGISPASVPYFIAGQLIGVAIAYILTKDIKE
tara:strand:+ start:1376 stop:2041 length:666 start_codon:yes stop_codon:yes gene_type:complete